MPYIGVVSNKNNIQSFLFDINKFNISQSKQWLKDHNYRYSGVHTTKQFHRFRQYDPNSSMKKRTIFIDNGIEAIYEYH